jgi:hypothetical protein
MNRSSALTRLALVVLFLPHLAWTKGETLRIDIRGDGLETPIEITDPAITGLFDVWNGPGVTANGETYHMDPERQQGAFIDWPRGPAVTHPGGLRRLEVTFEVGQPRGDDTRPYVFLYELDTAMAHGYVYLPRWKNDLIWHGVEGTWFHASTRWDEIIGSILASNGVAGVAAADNVLGCTVGTGKVTSDGTIEFYRADGAGQHRTFFRFSPGNPEYRSVKTHLGDVMPEREAPVSCWPPRT